MLRLHWCFKLFQLSLPCWRFSLPRLFLLNLFRFVFGLISTQLNFLIRIFVTQICLDLFLKQLHLIHIAVLTTWQVIRVRPDYELTFLSVIFSLIDTNEIVHCRFVQQLMPDKFNDVNFWIYSLLTTAALDLFFRLAAPYCLVTKRNLFLPFISKDVGNQVVGETIYRYPTTKIRQNHKNTALEATNIS